MKKAVTINSIAEALKLSRNTVAKALNGQYVPEKTRQLVLKKAKELNYKSINYYDSTDNEQKYKILLISTRPLNSIKYFIQLIAEIENYCFAHNYELFQYTFNDTQKPFSELSQLVKQLEIDGIVAIECFDKNLVTKLFHLNKPLCFYDFCAKSITNSTNFDIISANDEMVISEFVRNIIVKYGLTRFCYVGDNTHCKSFADRYTGMLLGLFSTKTPHSKKEDILRNDLTFNYGNAQNLQTEILKLQYIPECFVCCNDFVARTLIHALHNMNLSVPKDVLVVGFDNVNEAVSAHPKITSFAVNKQYIGREIMHTIVRRIQDNNKPTTHINISATLVMRESTEKQL